MIEEANRFATGWVTYFRNANCRTTLHETDSWLRRKLRCVRLKHCKSAGTTVEFLTGRGIAEEGARKLAASGKGLWRLSNSHQAKQAMTNAWCRAQGLVSRAAHHDALNAVGNRRIRDPYVRWCESGAP
jgi:RNA-directed DNA polymerase